MRVASTGRAPSHIVSFLEGGGGNIRRRASECVTTRASDYVKTQASDYVKTQASDYVTRAWVSDARVIGCRA
jgi:hypothetical protein